MLKILDPLRQLNPFGGLDQEGVETVLDTGARVFLSKKVHHSFADGDEVVVNQEGHHTHGQPGKIVDARSDSRLGVKLDTGHLIYCHESDLVPAYFAPVASTVKILGRALDSGAVSVHDRVRIEACLEKVRTGNYATSPFGERLCDSPVRSLEIYAEKYQASDTSNQLSKRAKTKFESGLKIGDSVRDHIGRVAKITAIGEHSVTLDFGNGTTGMSLFGYLEAA
jgi:preprotein translocase subunit YajC